LLNLQHFLNPPGTAIPLGMASGISEKAMLFKKFGFIVLAALMGLVSAAHAQSGNVYNSAQIIGSVQEAVVIQVRNVTYDNPSQEDRMVGTGVGGVVGGLLGYAASRHGGNGQYVASLVGTAAGGLIGNTVAKHIAKTEARELLVRTTNGNIIAVVQPLPAQELFPGQHVAVLNQNGQVRIIATSDEGRDRR
jgi:outer membrane lipoprotein SlyB